MTLVAALVRFWPVIPITLAAVLGFLLVGQYKENGKLQTQLQYQTKYSAGLKNQLTEANNVIKDGAKKSAVAYGQCQSVVMNDASLSFDRGVTFGRASCPAPASH